MASARDPGPSGKPAGREAAILLSSTEKMERHWPRVLTLERLEEAGL